MHTACSALRFRSKCDLNGKLVSPRCYLQAEYLLASSKLSFGAMESSVMFESASNRLSVLFRLREITNVSSNPKSSTSMSIPNIGGTVFAGLGELNYICSPYYNVASALFAVHLAGSRAFGFARRTSQLPFGAPIPRINSGPVASRRIWTTSFWMSTAVMGHEVHTLPADHLSHGSNIGGNDWDGLSQTPRLVAAVGMWRPPDPKLKAKCGSIQRR